MKRISILVALLVTAAAGMYLLDSCVKKDFDSPEDNSGYDPNIPVNTTIAELLALPQNVAIDSDIVIEGVVVMDDKSGNYYKSIVIQDSTGGIQILLDQNNLYNDYPVGRKVYVKCKGLFLGNYGDNIQLGYTPDAQGSLSNIPFTLIADHLVKADYPNTIVPDTLTLAELASPNAAKQYLNKLVVIKNAEFDASALGSPYAQPASLASATNVTINDCDGGSIVLRTSGYAKFQPAIVPGGNGIITALYTRFKNDGQLFIRDTTDIQFTDSRCSSTLPETITIDSLKKLYTGSGTVDCPNVSIAGIIISDVDNKNVSANNYIIEDGSRRGIVLYVPNSNSLYKLGDSVYVNLIGAVIKKYTPNNQSYGTLEIDNLAVSKITKTSTGNTIEPITLTVGDYISEMAKYESVLVRIQNATISGGANFGGNRAITDYTTQMSLYTANAATFADEPIPSGYLTIIGIGTPFSNPEIKMRNLNDVQQ